MSLYDCAVCPVAESEVLTVPPCIVCDATRGRATYQVETVAAPIVVCEDCGLGYYHPMPDGETVAGFYPKEYYGEPGSKFRSPVEVLVRLVGRLQLARLVRDLAPGASVLDVGCGRGVLLGPLAERGFRAHGFEVNADAVSGADPRAEIRVAPDLAEAAYPSESFDAVILWHVLEHLRDPRGTLSECRRLLRPGGTLHVALPNFESAQATWSGPAWFHLDPPRHLYHFPFRGLWRLLERTGFAPRSVHHFSLRQNPFGWIQSALNLYSKAPRNALYTHLYRTERGRKPELTGLDRMWMWTALVGLAPWALAASVVAAVARTGATVHLVARRET